MTSDEYYVFIEAFCKEAKELSQRKNNDYAAPDRKTNDPFSVFGNFVICERLGICKTEQGFLVRITDKLARIINLLDENHKQKVKDESILDTIEDLHNYTCLLRGFLETVKTHGRPTFKKETDDSSKR